MDDDLVRCCISTLLKPCCLTNVSNISSRSLLFSEMMMSMSIDNRFAEFVKSINTVPPLNIKGKPDVDNPSNSSNARITFSKEFYLHFYLP